METPFEAFMAELHLAGRLVQEADLPGVDRGRLPDRLNGGGPVELADLRVAELPGGAGRPPEQLREASVDPDDLLVVVLPADALPPAVHAVHHAVVLALGPYRVSGDLLTLPGFDPGRALTRPAGQFIALADTRVEMPAADRSFVRRYPAVLVNRYAVDLVWSDIDLAFFFPGAHREGETLT